MYDIFIVAPTTSQTDETTPITQETSDANANNDESSDKGQLVHFSG